MRLGIRLLCFMGWIGAPKPPIGLNAPQENGPPNSPQSKGSLRVSGVGLLNRGLLSTLKNVGIRTVIEGIPFLD